MKLSMKIALDVAVYLVLAVILSLIGYKYFDFFVIDGAFSVALLAVILAFIGFSRNKHSDDKRIEFYKQNILWDMVYLLMATVVIAWLSYSPFSFKGTLTPILMLTIVCIFVNIIVFTKFDIYENSVKSERTKLEKQLNDRKAFNKKQILDELAAAESYKADKRTEQDLERLIEAKKKDSADKR